MLNWSYSTNGLTGLSLIDAFKEVEKAGYSGVELSFQKGQFDPYNLSDGQIKEINAFFSKSSLRPVAISSATTFYLSDIPHEPSLLSEDVNQRGERIRLIKRAVEIAKTLNIPIVSFQSGYVREEHQDINPDELRQRLIDGIKECLSDIQGVQLVIEPEPGMYIETLDDARSLIQAVGSDNFRLHIDIGHAFCTEENYVSAINNALDITSYMHLADIKEGYNLKFLVHEGDIKTLPELDFDYAGYLVFLRNVNSYLFMDKQSSWLFSDAVEIDVTRIKKDLASYHNTLHTVSLKAVLQAPKISDYDVEINAYIDSVSGVNLDLLQETKPVLGYLRSSFISAPICNTIKGKVHYHEEPGQGEIDFPSVLKMLNASSYTGYITVELYNHVDVWEKVLNPSRVYLQKCVNA